MHAFVTDWIIFKNQGIKGDIASEVVEQFSTANWINIDKNNKIKINRIYLSLEALAPRWSIILHMVFTIPSPIALDFLIVSWDFSYSFFFNIKHKNEKIITGSIWEERKI